MIKTAVKCLWPLLFFLGAAVAAGESPELAAQETPMRRATGSFEVELKPLELHHVSEDALLGRMSLDKRFQGDLDATSTGEMLSARTATEGSAGYVAIERVVGRLAGREGTFVLQHSSTMDQGVPAQNVQVVPGSGTGALTGLVGTMVIRIEAGGHFYDFDYALPATGDAAQSTP